MDRPLVGNITILTAFAVWLWTMVALPSFEALNGTPGAENAKDSIIIAVSILTVVSCVSGFLLRKKQET